MWLEKERILIKFLNKGQFAIEFSNPFSTVNISYKCIEKLRGFTIFS